MKVARFALVLLALAACSEPPRSAGSAATAPADRPNIVVVLVDDLRFDEFSKSTAQAVDGDFDRVLVHPERLSHRSLRLLDVAGQPRLECLELSRFVRESHLGLKLMQGAVEQRQSPLLLEGRFR